MVSVEAVLPIVRRSFRRHRNTSLEILLVDISSLFLSACVGAFIPAVHCFCCARTVYPKSENDPFCSGRGWTLGILRSVSDAIRGCTARFARRGRWRFVPGLPSIPDDQRGCHGTANPPSRARRSLDQPGRSVCVLRWFRVLTVRGCLPRSVRAQKSPGRRVDSPPHRPRSCVVGLVLVSTATVVPHTTDKKEKTCF